MFLIEQELLSRHVRCYFGGPESAWEYKSSDRAVPRSRRESIANKSRSRFVSTLLETVEVQGKHWSIARLIALVK